eukprot:scaffold5294_cov129-Cylindrotheca_fusiformis.AAC.4
MWARAMDESCESSYLPPYYTSTWYSTTLGKWKIIPELQRRFEGFGSSSKRETPPPFKHWKHVIFANLILGTD